MSIDLKAQVLAVAEAMRERDAEVRAANNADYYSENREHLRSQKVIFRLRNREHIAEYGASYHAANRYKILKRQKKYRAENIESITARHRKYCTKNAPAVAVQQKKYKYENRQSISEYQKKYRIINAESISKKEREYRNSHRILKGIQRGEAKKSAKLTEVEIVEIRKLYAEGRTQRALGAKFGVSHPTIHGIVLRKTWKHVI